MHIVIQTDLFHPEAGYLYNIVTKTYASLGHKVTIVTSELDNAPDEFTSFLGKDDIALKDDLFYKNTGVKILRYKAKRFIRTRAQYNINLLKVIKELKPDILETTNDSIFGINVLLNIKKLPFPVVFESSMLKMASHSRLASLYEWAYRKVITPIIIKNKLKVIRVQDDPYLEQYLGIPLKQCPYISFGSDVTKFYKSNEEKRKYRNEFNLTDADIVFIYAGKITKYKGADILANAFAKKFKSSSRVVLLLIGNLNTEYGKLIKEEYDKSENSIIFFPTQKYIDLDKFFKTADVCIFPKECSLSFFDAQACGLPIIFEDNEVNKTRVVGDNALLFKSGDVNSLREVIQQYIGLSQERKEEMSKKSSDFILEQYNYVNKAKEFLNIYKQEIMTYNTLGGKK